jgi:hypothetical protein
MPTSQKRQCNSTTPRCPYILPPIIPKLEPQKNKSEIRGIFFRHKNPPSTDHDSPRIHHKLTIKKPRSTTRFLPKPPVKRRKTCPRKNTRVKIQPLMRIDISNTKVLLILGQIQLIVEVGGLSNDEVYTNSHRGLALRVILCHIRNFDRSRSIPQHKSRHENRVASGGPVVPAGCCSGFLQVKLLGKLPGLAHFLPLFCSNRWRQVSLREGTECVQ